jgi:hypothetical protein
MQQQTDQLQGMVGLPMGTLRGTIVDVDDPKDRGRVKVIFDDMNPDIPQVSGAGDWSERRIGEAPDESHWIDTSPAFKGKQPKGLVGKRVNISASNGQYQYAVLQDVMFDPQLLAEGQKKKLDMPNNSSMTRLPVYPSGELPPATAENVGCVIIEEDGFDGMQWLSVCLLRSGGYTWVNMMDRLHIHDSQANDSAGDSEGTVNDDTHATT